MVGVYYSHDKAHLLYKRTPIRQRNARFALTPTPNGSELTIDAPGVSRQRTRCGETTNGNECVLFWNDGNHKLHIELGRDNNVATFPLAHGYPKFEAFCCEAALNDPSSDPIAMPSSIISDDEDDHEEVTTGTPQSLKPSWQRNVTSSDTGTPQTTGTTTFDLNGPSIPAPGGESAQTPRSKNLRTS
ncbi:hypothetical protein MHU86_19517 [Fragilaria crotonensis]|nr:hypothetical protein MHU86_19517 [Fragilaria crotonensis]